MPKAGPLSYLSTVTTVSDWGSQSLQRLGPQPSALAQQPSGLLQQPSVLPQQPSALPQQPLPAADRPQQQPTGSGAAASKTALSASRTTSSDRQTAASNHRSDADAPIRVTPANSNATASAATAHEPSNTAQARATEFPASQVNRYVSAGGQALPNQAQRDAQGAARGSDWGAGWGAFDTPSSATAATPQANINNAAEDSNTNSHSVQQLQQDWSAFGAADPQAQPSDFSYNSGQQQQLSPGSADAQQPAPPSNGALFSDSQWQSSSQAAQQSAVQSFDTNFPSEQWQHNGEAAQLDMSRPGPGFTTEFEPAQWQLPDQHSTAGAVPAADNDFSNAQWQGSGQLPGHHAGGLEHMGSGDSFGDFNASGGHAGLDTDDWAAAPAMPADPFAASASFKDFAALLEPQIALAAGQDTSPQPEQQQQQHQPTANGFTEIDLAELQAHPSAGVLQGTYKSL